MRFLFFFFCIPTCGRDSRSSVNSEEFNSECQRVNIGNLVWTPTDVEEEEEHQIKQLLIDYLLDERKRTRDARASPRHDHGHRALLAECVSCCGGSTHYETTWHGVSEGFRLCWPSWAPSPPSVSWLSPLAPTTGFTPGRTSATPRMPPRRIPRCKTRKSEATWRTLGSGGSAVSKVVCNKLVFF